MTDPEYIPSTALVRDWFAQHGERDASSPKRQGWEQAFDRWHAQELAKERTKTLEEAAQIAETRYFGGGTIGPANRWGAKQAAVAIREAKDADHD